jgi:hypothetical protein
VEEGGKKNCKFWSFIQNNWRRTKMKREANDDDDDGGGGGGERQSEKRNCFLHKFDS